MFISGSLSRIRFLLNVSSLSIVSPPEGKEPSMSTTAHLLYMHHWKIRDGVWLRGQRPAIICQLLQPGNQVFDDTSFESNMRRES